MSWSGIVEHSFDLYSIVKWSVTILGELTILAGFIKWGISEYFKKNAQIEVMKEQQFLSQMKEFSSITEGMKAELKAVTTQLVDIDKLVLELNLKVQNFNEKTDHVIRSQEATNEMVFSSLQKFNNVQLHEYRKNHYVLRVPE